MALPTKKDLVERIGKSEDYWHDQCAAYAIPHRRIGKNIYFTEDDIAEIIAMSAAGPKKVPTRDEVAQRRAERGRRAA